MNVLIIHNKYLHEGGEDAVVRSEKELLKKYGHNVRLYQKENSSYLKRSLIGKVNFAFRDMVWSSDTYSEVVEVIKDFKPDIAHVHNTFLEISPSVYQACVDCGIPVVQTLHNYRLLCPNALLYRNGSTCRLCIDKGRASSVIHKCWRNSFAQSFLIKRAVDQFYRSNIITDKIDHFIALSDFSRDQFIRGGFPGHKMSVKPNFVSMPDHERSARGGYALFAGALRDYKGIDFLLKAWSQLNGNYELNIVGDGPLSILANKASIQSNVNYLGSGPHKEMEELIRNASCVIVPSKCFENFPRIIVESYALGVPIVASRIGALAEIVQNGVTGFLFETGNAVDLIEKVKKIMDDAMLSEKLGNNALELYLSRFTEQKNYESLMNVYAKASSSRKESCQVR